WKLAALALACPLVAVGQLVEHVPVLGIEERQRRARIRQRPQQLQGILALGNIAIQQRRGPHSWPPHCTYRSSIQCIGRLTDLFGREQSHDRRDLDQEVLQLLFVGGGGGQCGTTSIREISSIRQLVVHFVP